MRRRLLEYLACPACGGLLDCQPAVDDVVEGDLRCRDCPAAYPVRRGIPRLLVGGLGEAERRTADAFGWEWQTFRQLHERERDREQFLDWIHPLQPVFFADKVVLDAGCGMGRFAAVSAAFGAREVLAIDLSDAVETAADNLRDLPTVHVIQADLYRLPLRRGVVDFAYCIGVLHHLPDPERGFAAVAHQLADDGALFAWVYGRENNGWLVRVVNPVRERLFSRLPRRLLYRLSFGLALVLHPLTRLAGVLPLPYQAYLRWLAGYGLRHTHHVVFDHLVAPTAFYIRREEFQAWFTRAGLGQPVLSWRNQNSWRGFARRGGAA